MVIGKYNPSIDLCNIIKRRDMRAKERKGFQKITKCIYTYVYLYTYAAAGMIDI